MGEKSKRHAGYAYYLRKLFNDTNTLDSYAQFSKQMKKRKGTFLHKEPIRLKIDLNLIKILD